MESIPSLSHYEIIRTSILLKVDPILLLKVIVSTTRCIQSEVSLSKQQYNVMVLACNDIRGRWAI